MSPEDAPVGTVCTVGHPGNGVTASKRSSGRWFATDGSGREFLGDDLRLMRAVYIPGVTL